MALLLLLKTLKTRQLRVHFIRRRFYLEESLCQFHSDFCWRTQLQDVSPCLSYDWMHTSAKAPPIFRTTSTKSEILPILSRKMNFVASALEIVKPTRLTVSFSYGSLVGKYFVNGVH